MLEWLAVAGEEAGSVLCADRGESTSRECMRRCWTLRDWPAAGEPPPLAAPPAEFGWLDALVAGPPCFVVTADGENRTCAVPGDVTEEGVETDDAPDDAVDADAGEGVDSVADAADVGVAWSPPLPFVLMWWLLGVETDTAGGAEAEVEEEAAAAAAAEAEAEAEGPAIAASAAAAAAATAAACALT